MKTPKPKIDHLAIAEAIAIEMLAEIDAAFALAAALTAELAGLRRLDAAVGDDAIQDAVLAPIGKGEPTQTLFLMVKAVESYRAELQAAKEAGR